MRQRAGFSGSVDGVWNWHTSARFGAINLIEDSASLKGGCTYRSALTGGRAVTVRTPLAPTYHRDARP